MRSAPLILAALWIALLGLAAYNTDALATFYVASAAFLLSLVVTIVGDGS